MAKLYFIENLKFGLRWIFQCKDLTKIWYLLWIYWFRIHGNNRARILSLGIQWALRHNLSVETFYWSVGGSLRSSYNEQWNYLLGQELPGISSKMCGGPNRAVPYNSDGLKNLPPIQEIWLRSLGWEDPWKREWQPTPVFLPGESHGQRRLAGYSPWYCKELDMTEHACRHKT